MSAFMFEEELIDPDYNRYVRTRVYCQCWHATECCARLISQAEAALHALVLKLT